jgi:branched-chain amino acid transport system ATP-binding protein
VTILELRGINTFYGLSHILFDIDLDAIEGETVCLLGRNGVGKTTTLKTIIRLAPPRTGTIRFAGQDITGLKTHFIARLGIGYVPEDRIIFPDLTVRENLEIGSLYGRSGGEWDYERIYQLFPVLKERERQEGGTLSGGEQQMLTIARTLMGNPTVLLLDEPSEGLAPLVVGALYDTVTELKNGGITILICEQNADFSLGLSDRSYLLEKGKICWGGPAQELKSKPEIMQRYLGV